MVRLQGSSYVADYSYCTIKQDIEERKYRYYVTDTLHVIMDRLVTLKGDSYLKKRYLDIASKIGRPDPENNGPEPTAEDIVARIKASIIGRNSED